MDKKFISGIGIVSPDYLAYSPYNIDVGIADTVIFVADPNGFVVVAGTELANTTAAPITVSLKSGATIIKRVTIPANTTLVLNTPFAIPLTSVFQCIGSAVGVTLNLSYDKQDYVKTLV